MPAYFENSWLPGIEPMPAEAPGQAIGDSPEYREKTRGILRKS